MSVDVKEIAGTVIDLRLPAHWAVRHFWIGGRRKYGVAVAFSPRIFALGVEVINGYGKGLAVMIGPFWIGTLTALLATEPTA